MTASPTCTSSQRRGCAPAPVPAPGARDSGPCGRRPMPRGAGSCLGKRQGSRPPMADARGLHRACGWSRSVARRPVVGVGEVDAGGGDVVELLARAGLRLGDVDDVEDFWAAEAGDLYGAHRGRSGARRLRARPVCLTVRRRWSPGRSPSTRGERVPPLAGPGLDGDVQDYAGWAEGAGRSPGPSRVAQCDDRHRCGQRGSREDVCVHMITQPVTTRPRPTSGQDVSRRGPPRGRSGGRRGRSARRCCRSTPALPRTPNGLPPRGPAGGGSPP